ncbi:MAG: tetratricopeptide repeat protein [Parachlamydia sp.]|nr:tetratricopeptide repeat protein [Parachlamydia sp.]
MSVQNVIGQYWTPRETIEFVSEGAAVVAYHFWEQQPPALYRLDQHSFTQLPHSDLPLSKFVQKLLAEQYIPSIQNGALAWAVPDKSNRSVEVQNLLSLAEQQAREKHFGKAVDALDQAQRAAARLPDPFGEAHFLEKLDREWVQSLLIHTQDPRVEHLLLQKDAIRMAFENSLRQLSALSLQKKPPTCFICFSIENDLGNWLENTFIPDLDNVGIAPLFCFRQFGPGQTLNRFQSLIRFSDSVVIMCTPELKKKCEERIDNPTGAAMEIFLATGRAAEPEKWKTIYPVYLKGSYPDLCPHPYLEQHLGVSLTFFGNSTPSKLLSYYADAFELFGSIRAIERSRSRVVKHAFLQEVQKILREGNFDQSAVQNWLKKAPEKKIDLREVTNRAIDAAMGQPLISKDRLRLSPAHPQFVGRSALLDQLIADMQLGAWRPVNPTIIRVLYGPAGIGKTELALAFGNRHLSNFSLVWFLRTESVLLFEEDYRDLAGALGVYIENEDKFEDVQRKVHKALEKGVDQARLPWLLILDNVETMICIPERGGYVIATSQLQNVWHDFSTFVKVPPFTSQETEALFQQMRYPLNQRDAELLVEKVEGFPVLLEQVGCFLQRTPSYSLMEYLQEVEEGELIWESRDGQRYPKMLGKVFEATLKRLVGQNKETFAFIQFCTYLNPDRISIRLFDFWIKNRGLTPKNRREILGLLNAFQLLSYHPTSQTFSCHRLVQLVLQHLDATGEVYDSSFDLLIKWANGFDWQDMETWERGEECVHHAEKMRKTPRWETVEKEKRSDLLLTMGFWISRVKWNHKYGLVLLEEAQENARSVFGEESKEVARIEGEIGACHSYLKDNKQAAFYFSKCLNTRRAKLGEFHPETARSYSNLASVVPSGSQQALEHSQKALEIWQAFHQGNAHVDVAIGYHNLALCLSRRNRISLAIDSIKQGIKISEDYFKRPHPQTAHSYFLLGEILSDSCALLEALAATKKSVDIYQIVYGKTHKTVAAGYRSLGYKHGRLHQYDLAIQMFDESMKIYRDLYGENSSENALLLIGRGQIFFAQKAFHEALEISQKALRMLQAIHQEDHYDLAIAFFNVAGILRSLKRYQESLMHFQIAWKIVRQGRGDEDELTILALFQMGLTLGKLRRYQESLSHFVTGFQAAVRTEHALERVFFDYVHHSLGDQSDMESRAQVLDELLRFCKEKCKESYYGSLMEYKSLMERLQKPHHATELITRNVTLTHRRHKSDPLPGRGELPVVITWTSYSYPKYP